MRSMTSSNLRSDFILNDANSLTKSSKVIFITQQVLRDLIMHKILVKVNNFPIPGSLQTITPFSLSASLISVLSLCNLSTTFLEINNLFFFSINYILLLGYVLLTNCLKIGICEKYPNNKFSCP